MNAEDVLNACDENTSSGVGGGEGMGLANPAVHLLRGLRSRNISAIRHATQVSNIDRGDNLDGWPRVSFSYDFFIIMKVCSH
jgi:hypothetical protein